MNNNRTLQNLTESLWDCINEELDPKQITDVINSVINEALQNNLNNIKRLVKLKELLSNNEQFKVNSDVATDLPNY